MYFILNLMLLLLYYADHWVAEDEGRGRKNGDDQILRFLLFIPASAANAAAAVNPKVIKTFLPNS